MQKRVVTIDYARGDERVFFVGPVLTAHITPVDAVIARVSFKTLNTQGPQTAAADRFVPRLEVPVPPEFSLVNTSLGQAVPVTANGFFIAWSDNYELRRGAERLLVFRTARQHTIDTDIFSLVMPARPEHGPRPY